MFNNQTPVPHEKKDTAIKSLAIVGLIAVVCLIVWALVQAVRLAPSAFVSLASIADGLYSQEEPLTIGTNKTVVNTGEPFYMTWSDVNRPGAYYFTYTCTEGVSAEARNTTGDIVLVTCETPFVLGHDAGGSLEVIFEAEKRRFTDVPYKVTYTRENENEIAYNEQSLITVVNAAITQSSMLDDEKDDETDQNDDAPTGNVAGADTNTGSTNTGNTGGGIVRSVPVTTTYFPTSDPNGTVDLEVIYLGVGSLDNNNEFSYRLTLDNDRRGALRFQVKNIGTKTSDDWEFEAVLPTDPESKYASPEQNGLRPNERAIITLGFDNLGDARDEEVEVEISGGDDDNDNNNSFDVDVEVVN